VIIAVYAIPRIRLKSMNLHAYGIKHFIIVIPAIIRKGFALQSLNVKRTSRFQKGSTCPIARNGKRVPAKALSQTFLAVYLTVLLEVNYG
jgi:hypothetical protein